MDLHHVDYRCDLVGLRQIKSQEVVATFDVVDEATLHGVLVDGCHIGQPKRIGLYDILH